MKPKTLFFVALGVLLVMFAFGTSLYYLMNNNQVIPLPDVKRAALVRMHSPTLGKIEAPVVIVEFLDPACGTCAEFYPRVKAIMQTARTIAVAMRV